MYSDLFFQRLDQLEELHKAEKINLYDKFILQTIASFFDSYGNNPPSFEEILKQTLDAKKTSSN